MSETTSSKSTWLIYLPVAKRSGTYRSLHIADRADAEAIAKVLTPALLQKIANAIDLIKDPD